MPRSRSVRVLCLLLITCSCAPTAPATAPARVGAAPAAPAAPTGALVIPRGVIAPRGTLLLGDLHGTREIPAFVGRVVATLAAEQPVVLALEIRHDQAPSIDGFLVSDGGPAARDAMLRDPWWQVPYQDGRRSVAMLELLDAVRALRKTGARVDVECFDPKVADTADADRREDGMARNVLAIRAAHPDAALVVYAGNLHTIRKGVSFRPGYAWMAMRMVRAGVAFVTLDPRYGEGSAWVCQGATAAECGPQFVAGAGDDRGIHLEASSDGNYDGWFGVGALTASPPAGLPALSDGFDAQLAALRDGPGALRARARRAHRAKDYPRCAAELGRIASPEARDAYNQACCLALGGDRDAAFERLRFAIDHGFTDLAAAGADADLTSLHGDPRWPLAPKP